MLEKIHKTTDILGFKSNELNLNDKEGYDLAIDGRTRLGYSSDLMNSIAKNMSSKSNVLYCR